VSVADELPLAGVRVVDLTMVWAGPFATKHLADLGAEVIKIEGPGRVDLVRSLTVPDPSAPTPYNNSRYFNEYNRNKLGMCLDLRHPDGQRIVQELVAKSDVLIENFRPGVIDRLNLGYDRLREINPRVIVVSIPGYSSVPPERTLPGYGPNVEQMGGLAYFSGYTDGPPQKSGISYGDPIAGLGGVSAVLMALVQREKTGVGCAIEVGQRNLLVVLVGDAVVAHQLGVEQPRIGNRSVSAAPQGVYPCVAETDETVKSGAPAGSWLALSVTSDEQWSALCTVLDRADLAASGRFDSAHDRRAGADEIDAAITRWTSGQLATAAADRLQAAGVPASPVRTPVTLLRDAQLQARDFFTTVPHPDLGSVTVTSPTWHFHDVTTDKLRTAPRLGEHNRHVLTEVLGYSDADVDRLEADAVLADRPLGA
jgi:crotonobetainyl-CoA:carnitine CoA-transferase CaiB-like acyl-CoA transferase